MKLKFLSLFACLIAAVVFSGCVSTVDGHMRAGVPMSKDKITSKYERSVDQILAAAREVLGRNGQVVSDDVVNKAIKAKVNQRDVYVKASEIDNKVSQVVVQARTSGGGADIDLASEVSKQIGIQLAISQ